MTIQNLMHFLQVVQENDRVVIDFNADWCGPCKVIKPDYHKLAEQYTGKGRPITLIY